MEREGGGEERKGKGRKERKDVRNTHTQLQPPLAVPFVPLHKASSRSEIQTQPRHHQGNRPHPNKQMGKICGTWARAMVSHSDICNHTCTCTVPLTRTWTPVLACN